MVAIFFCGEESKLVNDNFSLLIILPFLILRITAMPILLLFARAITSLSSKLDPVNV